MWLLLSQAASVFISLQDISSKNISKRFDSFLFISFFRIAFSLVFLIPLLIFKGIPSDINLLFWGIVLIRALFDFFGVLFYSLSLKKSDISVSTPMLAFMPIFAYLSSLFLTNDKVSFLGFIGIITIIIGAFTLLSGNSIKLVKLIGKESGPIFMLGTAFFFGINASLHKISLGMITDSDESATVIFSITIGYILITFYHLPFLLSPLRKEINEIRKMNNILNMFLIGGLTAAQILLQIFAINMTNPSYVSAATRMSIAYSAILSTLFFREQIKKRIIPILIMLLGVIIFTLA